MDILKAFNDYNEDCTEVAAALLVVAEAVIDLQYVDRPLASVSQEPIGLTPAEQELVRVKTILYKTIEIGNGENNFAASPKQAVEFLTREMERQDVSRHGSQDSGTDQS